jgi:hypothetical protein
MTAPTSSDLPRLPDPRTAAVTGAGAPRRWSKAADTCIDRVVGLSEVVRW